MSITVEISSSLRIWIIDNLERGTSPAAMTEMLIGRKFEPSVARGLIGSFLSARAAGRALAEASVQVEMEPPRYVYEAARVGPGHLIRACGHEIRVLQRLQKPVIVMLQGVMSAAECAQLIDMARPRLRSSTVIDSATGANITVDHRRSEGMFFRPSENPFIAELDNRLAAIMNSPTRNGEGLQVLRYGCGGQYPPHFDFLDPASPLGAQSIARSGQRIGTLIVYLNDVIGGGETVFPEVGLSVVPHRGNGLYFEYANSRKQVDPRSAHGGAPVTLGEKWIVTKWMRSQEFVPAAYEGAEGLATRK
jgi:prolyl 4-hydroxylase